MNKNLILLVLSIFLTISVFSQKTEKSDFISEKTLSALKFRSIGPALMSGRISDIAIDPKNESIWYITAGSGGVWKTTNAGTTWVPIFDSQPVYSIGCVTIDPNNSHTIWVGTGENVGGRHVGFGDGIYRSDDDGKSWKNMGLKESQHISKIIIHPENSNIIWVAAQGPLWNKGGERGFFMSNDGGKSWNKTLGDEEWTGVTDMVIDPRNPDLIYAATWQRGRTVANYMGGGPGSAIYKSVDGGLTWKKLKSGLPSSNMGKIGLAISPQKPDVVYAAIELDRRTGGVYRSDNMGESWKKMSDAVAGATGPHYYQELYACPHNFDRIYLMDVRIQVSDDGGKTFRRLKERNKHSDNHAIAFKENDPDYLLVGTDGGMYESFDLAENWRFMANLPLTQYYKVAVDDTEPFYNIYGGTQDNGTQGGPSQTPFRKGISNADWFLNLYADGHQPATEPGNPNIVYSETQEGGLHRIDRKTGEILNIKPVSDTGENYERFNWDSPILVSPHDPATIYFASQRLWKSPDRGNSWEVISPDLTLNQERFELPIMDKTWSWGSPWDVNAMSNYNTITSISESPVKKGLLYVGTDDGNVHYSEDDGKTWNKIDFKMFPELPATAFVNDIKADLFDENTVFIVFDNHKYGDFKPYIYKSTDKGNSWKSISSNLKNNTIVWRLVQDHVVPNLLFIATEFGIYTSLDGGEKWIKLKGGVPTISFRDLVIQKNRNDLVGASFGRSFYVLDDYSPLREMSENMTQNEAGFLPMRDALMFNERFSQTSRGKGSQGASYYIAENPPYGATFTYYLSEDYPTLKGERKKKEKELGKEGENIPFPGWDALDMELIEEKPMIILTILDNTGNVVRRLKAPKGKGIHRTTWDLKHNKVSGITQDNADRFNDFKTWSGFKAKPGNYSAFLSKVIDGEITNISDTINFNIKAIETGTLKGSTWDEIADFEQEMNELLLNIAVFDNDLSISAKKLKAMLSALTISNKSNDALYSEVKQAQNKLVMLEKDLLSSKSKNQVGEKSNPSLYNRMWYAMGGTSTSFGPTQTQKRSLEIAKAELMAYETMLKPISEKIKQLETKVKDAGAPLIIQD